MPSILINQIDPNQEFIQRTERIYIDPQELIALRKKRKSFKMVKSIYEPSQQYDELIDRNQLDKFNKYSSKNKNSIKNLSSPKLLSSRYSHIDNVLPHYKVQNLQQIIQNQKISPNVEFIWKLLPSSMQKQIMSYQEGDCVPFSSLKSKEDDKFLILSGEVRIIGKNENSFRRKAGYLYFLSNETKDKIKQIIVLRSTKILKIQFSIYQGIIKPYLRLKYSQRLNFIHICPFFIWNQQLSQDLAASIELTLTEKQEIIYQSNQFADKIYFVKQGIVLLERNTTLKNSLIQGYEQHYQKNEITQKDVILVVRKGMVFGVDGIIIKQFGKSSLAIQQAQTLNDEKKLDLDKNEEIISQTQKTQSFYKTTQIKERSNQRIYTARTLGKCQIYCLDKKVLETLFTLTDISQNLLINKKRVSSQQFQRLSLEYTSMLVTNGSQAINKIPIKRKQIQLNIEDNLQQKIKSFASIQSKPNLLLKNIKRSVQSPQKKFHHSRAQSQNQQQKKSNEQKDSHKFYLDEEKQINELRNRVRSQRQKSKILSIKKSLKQFQTHKSQFQTGKETQLPKIFLKKQQKSVSKQKFNQAQKMIKLDSIINKKLKQDPYNLNNFSPKINKLESLEFSSQMKIEKSELIKLLEQQKFRNKSNPSFINVKSYGSISSVISSVLKT